MRQLKGKAALLAGTKRVGQRVAFRLAEEGVNLAIAYHSSKDEAAHVAATAATQVERTHLVHADLRDEDDVKRAVEESASALHGLDFVVNLASGYPRSPFDTLDAAAWERGMAAAKGSYLLTVHAARRMMENSGPTRGHIVMFSDWAAGETPYADYLPYLTAKAAISFMTRAFAAELAPHGILVNAVAPGPTLRPAEISEEEWARDVIARAPLRRESSPDDIAEIIVALLKSESVTGEVIRVDAGRHIAGPG